MAFSTFSDVPTLISTAASVIVAGIAVYRLLKDRKVKKEADDSLEESNS